MQQSTSINEAFETLKSPLKRAEYLLSLAGVTVNAETGNLPTDAEVLGEAMEVREALAEADTVAAVEDLANEVKDRAEACRRNLGEAFSAAETARAASLTTRLKYLDRFAGEVRARLANLSVAS